MPKIPVSVIVTTRNEEENIAACLQCLSRFDDVIVVDSASSDQTKQIAAQHGAVVHDFQWNGGYPKKRQWCLDNIASKHDRIFFVDADERVPDALAEEIAALDWSCAGYFVQGRYVFDGRVLRHGLCNNKLVLIDKTKIEFPVVDDLSFDGMGEMEGHYQPVLNAQHTDEKIGQLKTPMIHQAYETTQVWEARHQRYARWEALMNVGQAWPKDPLPARQFLKQLFRALSFRGVAAFIHCYVFKFGFLDGAAGYRFACSRARYYRMISNASKALVQRREASTRRPEAQL